MIFALMLLAGQAVPQRDWFDEATTPLPREVLEQLGSGPHTLVISDRNAMTRIDYSSGAKCLKARDEARRQVAPPPNGNGVIYAPSSVKAFCVPR